MDPILAWALKNVGQRPLLTEQGASKDCLELGHDPSHAKQSGQPYC